MSSAIGQNPDLQQAKRFFSQIVFTVDNAGACAHVLDVSPFEGALVVHTVRMGELSVDHIGDDLHVAVRVQVKPSARADGVIVNYSEDTIIDIVRIVIFCK